RPLRPGGTPLSPAVHGPSSVCRPIPGPGRPEPRAGDRGVSLRLLPGRSRDEDGGSTVLAAAAGGRAAAERTVRAGVYARLGEGRRPASCRRLVHRPQRVPLPPEAVPQGRRPQDPPR